MGFDRPLCEKVLYVLEKLCLVIHHNYKLVFYSKKQIKVWAKTFEMAVVVAYTDRAYNIGASSLSAHIKGMQNAMSMPAYIDDLFLY